MKLYNKAIDKIVNLENIDIDKVMRDTDKMTDAQLINAGFYKVKYLPMGNKRYYNNVEKTEIVDGTYIVSYDKVELSLEVIQGKLLSDLAKVARLKFDQATSKYHAGEMSAWERLGTQCEQFIVDGTIGSLLQKECNVTGIPVAVYADIIIAKGEELDNVKAYISGTRTLKELEISGLDTVDKCILYEATPYDVEEDVLGEDNEPTGEKETVTYYTNNVSDWVN